MNKRTGTKFLAILLSLSVFPPPVFSEQVEFVTYYPAPENGGGGGGGGQEDPLHLKALTVGDVYRPLDLSGDTENGTALISDSLGIGPGFSQGNFPTAALHVAGQTNMADRAVFMPTGATGLMRMGVGTTTPAGFLHIATVDSNADIRVESNPATGVQPKMRLLALGSDTPAPGRGVWIQAGTDWTPNSTTPIRFSGMMGQPLHMSILENGNVGVGIANPTGRLHVQGPNDLPGNVFFMQGSNTPAGGVPSVHVGIGSTAVPGSGLPAVPNGQTGNLNVNDIFVRGLSGGQWLSALFASQTRIASGSYSGGGGGLRTINVGFRPELVIVESRFAGSSTSSPTRILFKLGAYGGSTAIMHWGAYSGSFVVMNGVITITATGFQVQSHANAGSYSHYWVAIGP